MAILNNKMVFWLHKFFLSQRWFEIHQTPGSPGRQSTSHLLSSRMSLAMLDLGYLII